MNRVVRLWALGAVAVGVVAGVAGGVWAGAGPAADDAPGPARPTSSDAGDAVLVTDPADAVPDRRELLGLWRVRGAADEPEPVWLWLDDYGSYIVFRECGQAADGTWTVVDGHIMAAGLWPAPWTGCAPAVRNVAPWLTGAQRYAAADGGWMLLDDDGVVRAILEPAEGSGDLPEAAVEYLAMLRDRPGPSSGAEDGDAPPALPADLRPARPEELVGRWILEPGRLDPKGGNEEPYLAVARDGSWHGTDGCNETDGIWRVVEGGLLLVQGGPTTRMICPGFSMQGAFERAERAGFDGEVLVLIQPEGEDLVRLVRDSG